MNKDIWNMITEYKTGICYSDVLCELKQRMLHNRLMKELFYNRFLIYERFAVKEPLVNKDFRTRGEEDLDYWGYGNDLYMEDYWERFRIIGCHDPEYTSEYFRLYYTPPFSF